MKRREPGSPRQCPGTGREAMAQMETHEIPSEHKKKKPCFFTVRVVKRWRRLPREAGEPSPSEVFRHGAGRPAPAGPARAGGQTSRAGGPCRPQPSWEFCLRVITRAVHGAALPSWQQPQHPAVGSASLSLVRALSLSRRVRGGAEKPLLARCVSERAGRERGQIC